jgi:uncharacterized protein involved in exopolysaccharide biosynthesis
MEGESSSTIADAGRQPPCPCQHLFSQLEESNPAKLDVTRADLLPLAGIVWQHRIWILKVTACGMLLATILVLLLPKTYTGTAMILPPQQSQSLLLALLGQMSSVTGNKELALKNPADVYVAMLRSRSVADALIARFNLLEAYRQKKNIDARKQLASRSEIAATKDGTITISVTDRDAKRSAALANGYVDELRNLTRRLALTEAAQRRVFFQQQLDDEKEVLSAAELALRATQERTGLIQPEVQGKAIIEAVAQTRAQIAMHEVSVRTMSSFSTDQNPELVREKERLAGLRAQLAKLERASRLGDGNIQVPTGKVPQAALEYWRASRDLKYHEGLFEFLSKQLEAARIDEAKNSVLVQVVDTAVEPERRSGPMRTIPVVLVTALTFLAASCWKVCEERFLENRTVTT